MRDELFLSTEYIEPGLRNDYWRQITRPFFETTLRPDRDDPVLEGSVGSRAIGTMLLGPTSFNHQQYRRDRRLVLLSGLDHYLVQLFVTGALEGDCGGQAISVEPGDICVFDMARVLTTHVRPGSTISIILPRERLDRVTGGRSLHGLVLRASSPVTRLLADFIVSLSALPSMVEDADASAIEDATITLLSSTFVHRPLDTAQEQPALTQVLRRRVLEFVDANLAQPNLGPALLMRRFRVSRAHLYRMFATDGGVVKVIREKRLDAAYRELTCPRVPVRSITEIAHELGFSGSSPFLRAFRTRFGMTPSEARQKDFAPRATDQRPFDIQAHFAGIGKMGADRRTPSK